MDEKRIPIGVQIHGLDRIISRILERRVREAGFDEGTLAHGRIIRYLYLNRGMDIFQKDIESHCNVGKSSVTSVLQLMEKKGLIRRESVENDARLKKVVLTDEGIKHREVVESTMNEMNEILLEGISEQQQEVFSQVLMKMRENLSPYSGCKS